MSLDMALLTSVQQAEAVCLVGAVLFVLYVMNALNLFHRE